ncbi:MAG: hypothetical protein RL254_1558 [Planctomycetota bacterium]|jgi:hypothetical protein
MELDIILRAVFAPAFAVFVAALVLHMISRKGVVAGRSAVLLDHTASWLTPLRWMPLLIVVPAIAAHVHLQPGFEWPCVTSYEWLPVALVIGAVVSVITSTVSNHQGQLLATVGTAVCAMFILKPPGFAGVGYQILAATIAVVASLGASKPAMEFRVAPFVALWIIAACASVLCVLSGFAKLGIVVGALSGGSAALAVAAAIVPSLRLGRGGATACACALTACMFIGAGYDESGFPWWTWVMLATSPALMGIGARFVAATRPCMQFCVVVAMPTALALSAVACAVLVSGVLTRKAVPSSSSDPYSSAVQGAGSTQRVTITQDINTAQP